MCAHAREGIFLKCKNVYTHFTPSLVAYFPKAYCTFTTTLFCPIPHILPLSHFRLLLPSAVSHSPIIMFPLSSHSPSSFAPDHSLCFTYSLRPPSHNSDIFTLQNKHTIKKNLHFSSNFSLFRLISSHIHIGAPPFSAPSIIYFHGESQSNISPLLP